MSRHREIAIELFGQKRGATMEPSEVYSHVAEAVVGALVTIRAEVNNSDAPGCFWLLTPLAQEGLDLAQLVEASSTQATQAAAYKVGYRAQMEDASAADPADRDKNLEMLASICKIVVPIPITLAP